MIVCTVHNGRLLLRRVGEGDAVHPEDDLGSRLHTLQGARRGEGEGHRLVGQLEVGLLLWVLLDELGQGLSLLALEGGLSVTPRRVIYLHSPLFTRVHNVGV